MGGGGLTTGCCFPYCFLEVVVGDQALMEGRQSRDGQIPLVSPPGKTLVLI